MKTFKLIAGIDISKDWLDVQIADQHGANSAEHLKVDNNAQGISKLILKLLSYGHNPPEILVCCENTGVYMDKLLMSFQSVGCTFWPVHPMVISSYKLNLTRVKNDKVDAKKILSFAMNHQQQAVHCEHKGWLFSQIRDLFRLRKQLTKMITQTKNQLHAARQQAYLSPAALLVYGQMIDLLQANKAIVDRELKNKIKQTPELWQKYQIMLSIPGIGPVIAAHIIAITLGFEKINNAKSFACFIGTAPFEYTSGTSIRKRPRVSKMAYKQIKADIHQGAMSVIRPGLAFHEYYKSMIAANKHHNWIINNISNKIIKLVFDLVSKNQLYDANLYSTNKEKFKNNLQMS